MNHPDTVTIERWEPDHGRRCVNCGQRPVVTGIAAGVVAYRGELCGPCTWGDAALRDPDLWNES